MNAIFASNDLLPFQTKNILAVGGTFTTLASLMLRQKTYDDDEIHHFKFSLENLISLTDSLNLSSHEILKKFPIVEKRAETIYGGALIAKNILQRISPKAIEISNKGLRFGTLLAGSIRQEFKLAN